MKNCFPKSSVLIVLSMSFILSFLPLSSQTFDLNQDPTKQENFYTVQKVKENFYNQFIPEERKGWKQFKRWEHFWAPRVFPTGKFPQALDLLADWNQYQNSFKKDVYTTQSQTWNLIGPITRPEGANESVRDQGIGRVNVIRFHKNTPDDLWAGAATGGVWRSTNAGKNWSKFPFTEFLSLGVSDIQISPSNPKVVYVATGDLDGSASSQNYYGIGIIKTTNAGADWTVTKVTHQLEDRKLFGKMFVSPTNENVVVATSNSGILKTTDGGETWTNKQVGFFIDLEFKPNNPNVLYASTYSVAYSSGSTDIYKSTDMGDTWKKMHTILNTARTAIEVTPANPDRIYALCVEANNFRFHSIWISEDQGENWDVNFTSETGGMNLFGWSSNGKDMTRGQAHYDLGFAVSPLDQKEIFVGGVNIWKSKNDGYNWTIMAHWSGNGAPNVHADHHDLKYSTDGSKIYSAHDGGIDVSTNGGTSWTYLADGMSITQYYKIGITDADPSLIIGGSQDNGSSMYKSSKWIHVLAGDGMACAIDSKDAKRLYGSIYNGDFYRSQNGGDSFDRMINQGQTNESGAWVAPIALDPQKPNVIYVGYNNVWRSTTYGSSGSFVNISKSFISSASSLQNIVVSPTNSDYVYATNYQTLWRTTDGGTTWSSLFTSDAAITGIAVSYEDPAVFYFTKSGFMRGNKVWKYDGTKQINLSGNLPNVPANCIVFQKNSPQRAYIGTDIGVFYSDYGSNIWEPYGSGLPNVIVNDLKINNTSKKLVAGTWGRGVWDAPILECNLPKPDISFNGFLQFCQGDSVTITADVTSGNILWSTGETTKQIIAKTTGDYSYMVTQGDGCNAKSNVVSVSVSPIPNLVLSMKKSPALCEGDSLVMSVMPGLKNYIWNTGKTGRFLTATTAGEYYCTAETGDGCETVSEIVTVSFHPIPDVPTISEEIDFLVSTKAGKYKWYLNDTLITDATEQRYKPRKIGKYKVEVATSGDCYTMSEPYDLLVSVSDEWTRNGSGNIEISPNPVGSMANIKAFVQPNVSATITITNLAGKELYKSNEIAGSNGINRSIDLSGFVTGTYFVTISTMNGSFTERLIKQ